MCLGPRFYTPIKLQKMHSILKYNIVTVEYIMKRLGIDCLKYLEHKMVKMEQV